MKNWQKIALRLIVLVFVVGLFVSQAIPVYAVSRTLYWVGGTATWDATAGAKWSLASGGASGEAVPDSDDDVFIDNFSGASVITTSVSSTCRDLDFTGGSGAFAGSWNSLGVNIYGNLTFSAGMTIVESGISYTFKSTTTGKTITSAGKQMGNTTFNGVGGEWTLQDAPVLSGGFTVTNGSVITNNQNFSALAIAMSNGSATLGTSVLSLRAINITGGTLSAASSILSLSAGANEDFIGNGNTFGTVTINVGGSYQPYISGANTFANLNIIGANATGDILDFRADQVITGTLTMTGYNATNKRMRICSNTLGTSRQLTAAAFSITNCNIRDIAAGNPTWDVSAGKNSDYGGNYGIIFTVPQTNYWVGNSGNYSDVLHWALTTGGVGGTGRVPITQDTAVFDTNSTTIPARTITFDIADICAINATNVANNPTFTAGFDLNGYGSLSIGTCVWNPTVVMSGRAAPSTIAATVALNGAIKIGTYSATVSLQSDITMLNTLTLTSGILDLNDFNTTVKVFDSSATTYSRSILMGSGVFTLTDTAAVTKWHVHETSYNQFCGTSTIILTSTGVNAQTFSPGTGQTFYNVTITGTGAYTMTIDEAATFSTLTITRDSVKTVKFPTSKTTTITGDFIMTPSGVVVLTLVGTTAPPTANVWTVSKATGFVGTDYLSLEDSTALGGAVFYAGSHSTFVSHVTGWLNSEPTAPAVTTVAASSITGTSAVLNGNLTSIGGYSPVYVYFEWGYTTSYGYTTAEITKTAIGTYDTTITIVPATTYHYRAAVRYGGTLHTYGLDGTVSPSTSGGVFTPLPAIPNRNRDAFIPTGGTDTFLPADAAMAGTSVPGYVLIHLLATSAFNNGVTINDAMAWAVFVLILGTALGMLAGIYLRRAIIVGVCFSMFLTIFLFIGVVPLGWAIVSWILTLEMGIAEARSG